MAKATAVGSHTIRWLSWATAGLLTAGVASAGALAPSSPHQDVRIVTAAGQAGALEPPPPASSTATGTPAPPPVQFPAPPEAPTTAPVTPTSRPVPAPKTSTTATTVAPTISAAPSVEPGRTTATTAFNPPGPPVTPPPPPTTPTTMPAFTTTTITGRATVTIVSQYAYDVDVAINGQPFRVPAGQSVGPLDLAVASNGNDSVEVRVVSIPTCGEGDAGGYMTPGGRFRFTVVTGGTCGDAPGVRAPDVLSTPA